MDFLTSLINISLLLAMAVPGFLLKKFKMLPDKIVPGLVVIMMYVSQPFLTISSFSKKAYNPGLLLNMGISALISLVAIVAFYYLSRLCFCFSKEDAAKRAFVTSSYMSNCAFMGIPVLQAFFPDNPDPIIYAAVFVVVFNILAWTLSVYTLTGEKKHINLKKAFFNPPTLALVVALPLFFAGVVLPRPIQSTVDYLGNMTSPISMIIMGIRLADIKPAEIFLSGKVYISAAVKLIISPLITFGLLLLIRLLVPLDGMLIQTFYIIMAMPTAATVIMFAEKFEADSRTAVKCMLTSSTLSILTIPLLMLMCVFI